MPNMRAQVAVWFDSLAPRDAMMINPTFKDVSGSVSYDSLANDLATAVNTKLIVKNQIRVRIYNLDEEKPRYAKAEKILNTGVAGARTNMGELAVCLSFYASQNIPRRRGRVYIPLPWIYSSASAGPRPSGTNISDAKAFATIFADLGGIDVDWTVYSERNGSSNPVTNYWVDDEWDVQRRRGLKATTRSQGTTTEAVIPNIVRLAPQTPELDLEEA